MAPNATFGNGRRATKRSIHTLDQVIKNVCDIMRRGNCAGALQYVPELTWILFLRILDRMEMQEEMECNALGVPYTPTLQEPFRWRDWATPGSVAQGGAPNKRHELQNEPANSFFSFVNSELLPYLHGLKDQPNATSRQKVVSQIISDVDHVHIDTERNFLDVIDRVDSVSNDLVQTEHAFTLSQVYEQLLLKMGEKGNDGGQFFTPRQVIKAMVMVIDPKIDETVHDPCCGTGGFLAQSYEHVVESLGDNITPQQIETMKYRMFSGREKENLVYPIALANLVLHGIDQPSIWHGNTLTGQELYGGLFEGMPLTYDVILTNPPFGGQESIDAQIGFDYQHSSTQILFLQHIIRNLSSGGRCGIVLDEGLLFRMDDAFVNTKRLLLDECNLWCIVSMPAGVFTSVGAGVKTNLLFFEKGSPTESIWYYDLTDVKVRKSTPICLSHFEHFFQLLPERADSDLSWTVDINRRKREARESANLLSQQVSSMKQASGCTTEGKMKQPTNAEIVEVERRAKFALKSVYNLKAENPHKKPRMESRSPQSVIADIEQCHEEMRQTLSSLRRNLGL